MDSLTLTRHYPMPYLLHVINGSDQSLNTHSTAGIQRSRQFEKTDHHSFLYLTRFDSIRFGSVWLFAPHRNFNHCRIYKITLKSVKMFYIYNCTFTCRYRERKSIERRARKKKKRRAGFRCGDLGRNLRLESEPLPLLIVFFQSVGLFEFIRSSCFKGIVFNGKRKRCFRSGRLLSYCVQFVFIFYDLFR